MLANRKSMKINSNETDKNFEKMYKPNHATYSK